MSWSPVGTDKRGRGLVRQSFESSTRGRYAEWSDAFDVPANSTVKRYLRPRIACDLIKGALWLEGNRSGDVVSFAIAPLTPAKAFSGGADVLTGPIAIGQSKVTIPPTILATLTAYNLLDEGFYGVTISSTAGVEGPYYVRSWDPLTGVVELENVKTLIRTWSDTEAEPTWAGFTLAHPANADLLLTRYLVPHMEIDGAQSITLGGGVIDSSAVPAETVMMIEYQNNNTAATRVRYTFDLFTGVPLP